MAGPDIAEWYGIGLDQDLTSIADYKAGQCPFLGRPCSKKFSEGEANGVCSLKSKTGVVTAICPHRMMASDQLMLRHAASVAFGPESVVVLGSDWERSPMPNVIVALGQGEGGEVGLGARESTYSVDWVLAKVDSNFQIVSFSGLEVQTVDTTGSYRLRARRLHQGKSAGSQKSVGMNWENVNKRIIPQLALKGQIMKREPLCHSGIFFACPVAVYERLTLRLGQTLPKYPLQPGSITFLPFEIVSLPDQIGTLAPAPMLTSTVDALEAAWKATSDLPEANWGEKIQGRLDEIRLRAR